MNDRSRNENEPKPIGFRNEFWAVNTQMKLNQKGLIWFTITLVTIFSVISITHGGRSFLKGHWGWLEPVTGIITVLIGLLIWRAAGKESWRKSLPRRLTVQFNVNGKMVMECQDAYLAGEAEIRAWGQQLGSQMAESVNRTGKLKMEPTMKQGTGIIEEIDGQYVMSYHAIINLRAIPEVEEKKSLLDEQIPIRWKIQWLNGVPQKLIGKKVCELQGEENWEWGYANPEQENVT